MSTTAVNMELLQAAVAAMPADSLTAVRQSAASRFVRDGFPTIGDEDWKYTNLSAVADLSNAWLDNFPESVSTNEIPDAAKAHLDHLEAAIDAHWLVVSGGRILPIDNDVMALPGGEVEFRSLSEEIPENGLLAEDSITRFNAALLRDGNWIRVLAGSRLDKPIGFLMIDSSGIAPSVTQSRFVIDIGANAEINIIQAYWSDQGSDQFANVVTELDLAQGAHANVVQIQESADDQVLISTLVSRLHGDSVFNHNSYDLGGKLVRNDVKIDIAGAGAECTLSGLYLAKEGQHIDNHTRVDHRVGPARSSETYRGILGHRSHCVFNGKAIVHVGADGSDANQANHNLLLSDQAEIDTKPELEIYADDVKCSHGATVGQLDKQALYYLRTRGLDKDEATAVLTRSFASSILSELAIEGCRDYIAQRIDERLDKIIRESRT
jgi:Fe-S cluster assembly protein SufD